MFGMSGTEMIIILVLALLLFGPNKLPEMAKMIGKGLREFNKATNDIRSTVESEFNKLADLEPPQPPANGGRNVIKLEPPAGAVAANAEPENVIAPPASEAKGDPTAEVVEPAAPAPAAEKGSS